MMNAMGSRNHQILIDRLKADTTYNYEVVVGQRKYAFQYSTAPKRGSHQAIRFAFATDSREGKGGGERSFFGTNAYMMKKIGALSLQQKADFMQFTGDLISGYRVNPDDMRLQYANWKKSVEPFWHYFPIYTAIGNHEASITSFGEVDKGVAVDKFPFETQSTEKLFMDEFCNPLNGPESEDGNMYDVDKQNVNFPTYKENVYYYTYGNIAMVVLNTDYWYAPSTAMIPVSGGNPHSFIMDQQLGWLAASLAKLESDITIDHIFVSLHSPVFPNGGHANKSMWYFGNNDIRPFVSGNPTEKGIIERRDQLLDLIVNKSKKVVALLCGDEHNYSRMLVSGKMEMYPEDWDNKKITLSREIWQITNGSAGAPYYGQEQLPWSGFVEYFTPQYALVLVDVVGNHVHMKVLNPDTLETIEEVVLK
jgi:phosphodiesterase/alkaline phosphatase D-like protein